MKTVGILEAIRWANTGKLAWAALGPLLEPLMAKVPNLPDVSLDDLKAKSIQLGLHIDDLDAAIAAKEARDAQG